MQAASEGIEPRSAADTIEAIVIDPAEDGTCSLRIFHTSRIEIVPCVDEAEAHEVLQVRLAALSDRLE